MGFEVCRKEEIGGSVGVWLVRTPAKGGVEECLVGEVQGATRTEGEGVWREAGRESREEGRII